MKKIVLMFFLFVGILTLVACGPSENNQTPSEFESFSITDFEGQGTVSNPFSYTMIKNETKKTSIIIKPASLIESLNFNFVKKSGGSFVPLNSSDPTGLRLNSDNSKTQLSVTALIKGVHYIEVSHQLFTFYVEITVNDPEVIIDPVTVYNLGKYESTGLVTSTTVAVSPVSSISALTDFTSISVLSGYKMQVVYLNLVETTYQVISITPFTTEPHIIIKEGLPATHYAVQVSLTTDAIIGSELSTIHTKVNVTQTTDPRPPTPLLPQLPADETLVFKAGAWLQLTNDLNASVTEASTNLFNMPQVSQANQLTVSNGYQIQMVTFLQVEGGYSIFDISDVMEGVIDLSTLEHQDKNVKALIISRKNNQNITSELETLSTLLTFSLKEENEEPLPVELPDEMTGDLVSGAWVKSTNSINEDQKFASTNLMYGPTSEDILSLTVQTGYSIQFVIFKPVTGGYLIHEILAPMEGVILITEDLFQGYELIAIIVNQVDQAIFDLSTELFIDVLSVQFVDDEPGETEDFILGRYDVVTFEFIETLTHATSKIINLASLGEFNRINVAQGYLLSFVFYDLQNPDVIFLVTTTLDGVNEITLEDFNGVSIVRLIISKADLSNIDTDLATLNSVVTFTYEEAGPITNYEPTGKVLPTNLVLESGYYTKDGFIVSDYHLTTVAFDYIDFIGIDRFLIPEGFTLYAYLVEFNEALATYVELEKNHVPFQQFIKLDALFYLTGESDKIVFTLIKTDETLIESSDISLDMELRNALFNEIFQNSQYVQNDLLEIVEGGNYLSTQIINKYDFSDYLGIRLYGNIEMSVLFFEEDNGVYTLAEKISELYDGDYILFSHELFEMYDSFAIEFILYQSYEVALNRYTSHLNVELIEEKNYPVTLIFENGYIDIDESTINESESIKISNIIDLNDLQNYRMLVDHGTLVMVGLYNLVDEAFVKIDEIEVLSYKYFDFSSIPTDLYTHIRIEISHEYGWSFNPDSITIHDHIKIIPIYEFDPSVMMFDLGYYGFDDSGAFYYDKSIRYATTNMMYSSDMPQYGYLTFDDELYSISILIFTLGLNGYEEIRYQQVSNFTLLHQIISQTESFAFEITYLLGDVMTLSNELNHAITVHDMSTYPFIYTFNEVESGIYETDLINVYNLTEYYFNAYSKDQVMSVILYDGELNYMRTVEITGRSFLVDYYLAYDVKYIKIQIIDETITIDELANYWLPVIKKQNFDVSNPLYAQINLNDELEEIFGAKYFISNMYDISSSDFTPVLFEVSYPYELYYGYANRVNGMYVYTSLNIVDGNTFTISNELYWDEIYMFIAVAHKDLIRFKNGYNYIGNYVTVTPQINPYPEDVLGLNFVPGYLNEDNFSYMEATDVLTTKLLSADDFVGFDFIKPKQGALLSIKFYYYDEYDERYRLITRVEDLYVIDVYQMLLVGTHFIIEINDGYEDVDLMELEPSQYFEALEIDPVVEGINLTLGYINQDGEYFATPNAATSGYITQRELSYYESLYTSEGFSFDIFVFSLEINGYYDQYDFEYEIFEIDFLDVSDVLTDGYVFVINIYANDFDTNFSEVLNPNDYLLSNLETPANSETFTLGFIDGYLYEEDYSHLTTQKTTGIYSINQLAAQIDSIIVNADYEIMITIYEIENGGYMNQVDSFYEIYELYFDELLEAFEDLYITIELYNLVDTTIFVDGRNANEGFTINFLS